MTDLVNNAQLLIIASHSKDLLYKICNRIIWLEHGKIKMDGKPYDVLPEYFN
jgi:lipopolysaccharide transport system ATP-binding protein